MSFCRLLMRWMLTAMCLWVLASWCSTMREVTIDTAPGGALLRIDGVDRGRAPLIERFIFEDPEQVHRVVAVKEGYKETPWTIERDFTELRHTIELKPLTRVVLIKVTPVPGVLFIDGEQVTEQPVSTFSRELT